MALEKKRIADSEYSIFVAYLLRAVGEAKITTPGAFHPNCERMHMNSRSFCEFKAKYWESSSQATEACDRRIKWPQ